MAIQIGPTGQRFDLIAQTFRDHDPIAREALRAAGLSMNSELDEGQARILHEFCDEYGSEVPGHRLRIALLPSLRGEGETDPIRNAAISVNGSSTQGESIMAKTATKKSAPTKAQIAKVASMRRDGATWDEVISETGIRTNSTGFRELLESAGFDKYGRKKGSSQKSKAKGWGSAAMKNGKASTKSTKGKVRRVKRTKATAKK